MDTNTLLLPSSHRFCEVSSNEAELLGTVVSSLTGPADVGEMTTQTGVQSFTEAGSCVEHTTHKNTC